MKKLLCAILFLLSFVAKSQNFKKTFLTILDEYIEKETSIKWFTKDKALLYVAFDHIDNNGYRIYITMYEFEDYRIEDSLKIHNGVKMLVRYPKKMEKQLSQYFRPIKDTRNPEDTKTYITTDLGSGNIIKEEVTKMIESVSSYTFQINKKNEIYFIMTNIYDDEYYYKKLRKRKLKFSKDLKFTKDMY